MALVLTQQRARNCLCLYKQVSKFKFSITTVLEGSNLYFQALLEIFSSNFAILGKRMGSKGWRSGESTRLPPMRPGFKSQHRRHMWVEFVVGSLPCSRRFFSGYSGFPFSSKINISKFQFDQESGRRRTTLWMCYLQIIIYLLFIYSLKHRSQPGQPGSYEEALKEA